MNRVITTEQGRFFLAGIAFISGFVAALLLLHQNSFSLAIAAFSISIATLVGTGKFSSP